MMPVHDGFIAEIVLVMEARQGLPKRRPEQRVRGLAES